MWTYLSPFQTAEENLALEECLLQAQLEGRLGERGLLLYRHSASVVFGRAQNPFAEVNWLEVRRSGLSVLRRNSGGGTVYHDLGNWNYALFTPQMEDLDFGLGLAPIMAFLRSLGLEVERVRSSDLLCNGKKISGNAAQVKSGRLLLHGTLLCEANLEGLERLLDVPERFEHQQVRSRRSEVGNLLALLPALSMDEVALRLTDFVPAYCSEERIGLEEAERQSLIPDETVRALAQEKYRSREWNLGKTGRFSLDESREVEGQSWHLKLCVEKGRFSELVLRRAGEVYATSACRSLVGEWFLPEVVEERGELAMLLPWLFGRMEA